MSATRQQTSAGQQIDDYIEGLGDWRGDQLAKIRRLIHDAVDDVEETWKWMGSPVWESAGIIAVGNAHADKVKLTFPQGAHLDDPDHVFNNGFGGKAWRAIDLYEGDTLNQAAFRRLLRRAAEYNAERHTSTAGA